MNARERSHTSESSALSCTNNHKGAQDAWSLLSSLPLPPSAFVCAPHLHVHLLVPGVCLDKEVECPLDPLEGQVQLTRLLIRLGPTLQIMQDQIREE
jgi:hypothetical protein